MRYRLLNQYSASNLLITILLMTFCSQSKAEIINDPCKDIPALTAHEVEKVITPWLNEKTFITRRNHFFWRYGYRTPQYPDGAPKDVYDLSTPILSQNALDNPTGTLQDYKGPADENIHAQELFKIVSGGAHYSNVNYGNFNGLYTAVDPLGSLGFFHGSLMRIEAPSGSKFVRLNGEGQGPQVSKFFFKKVLCENTRKMSGPESKWRPDIKSDLSNTFSQLESTQHLSFGEIQLSSAGRDGIQNFYDHENVIGIATPWHHSPYLACRTKQDREGEMFVFTNSNAKVETKLMVDALEPKPSPQKFALYRKALDYFEAFDFSECGRTNSDICLHTDSGGGTDATNAFWKIYRAWAVPIYGLAEDISQSELEAFRQEKFLNLARDEVISSTYGCSADDQ